MAQGFAEVLGRGDVEADSAGSRPASQVDPLVIEVMRERGVDLSGMRPKSLNDLPSKEIDYMVTMGCEASCPVLPAREIIQWDIPDPKGKPVDSFREVRDLIEEKVRNLLKNIKQREFEI